MNLLKNNSNDMGTVVETFIIEETAELIYDGEKLDEWNKLVDELGLVGQTKIVSKEKSPIPFLHLKKDLVNAFEVLCPVKVKVTDYSVTPIPVEILSLVALSVNEKYFFQIEVWYDDKAPDPICVGVWHSEENIQKGYTWTTYAEHYLLGKWGDVRRSFGELITMARARFIEQEKVRLAAHIKQYNRELDDIELTAAIKFGSTVNGNDSNPDLPF